MAKANYTHFTGTSEEFISNIDLRMYACLKKPKGRNVIHLFWEDSNKWFVNEFYQKGQHDWNFDPKKSGWLIKKDMLKYITYMTTLGYVMYLMDVKVSRT